MKTIFDIIRLLNNRDKTKRLSISNKGYDISYLIERNYSAIHILKESEKYWYVFMIEQKKVKIEIPNLTNYDQKYFNLSIFDDILSLDDTQLVLIYGRIYPDYLSGDLTDMYDSIAKQLDTN